MSKHNIQSVAEVVEILTINFQQEEKREKGTNRARKMAKSLWAYK
ncbi:hypothetical protein [Helicobacter cinaedi]|nr:hypothetical protein [Helicobacter cinaedi]